MPIIMDPYERYRYYCDTALDVIINLIKNGTIQCGRNAKKIKYGVPPDEVKGWWLTNDKHREPEKEEVPEPTRSMDSSESGERKQNIVDLLREIEQRRNSGKYRD